MAKSKSIKQTKQDPKATTTQKQPPPNWPPLHPLLPSDSLTLDTLLPSQILTISNLWTSTLCAKYVAFLKTLPLATTPGIPKKGDAVRVNDRFQIEDPAFAERLWSETGLKDVVEGVEDSVGVWGGEVIGLNSNIRVYRYGKGQFFDQHCELHEITRFDYNACSLLILCFQTTTLTISNSHPPPHRMLSRPRRLGLSCCISHRL